MNANALSLKERRSVIGTSTLEIAAKWFATKQRLRRMLENGRNTTEILDHSRVPILKLVDRELSDAEFDILNEADTNAVERSIVHLVDEYAGKITPRDFVVEDAPPRLTGLNAPMISRRDDLRIPKDRTEGAQYLTDQGLCLEGPLVEILLERREQLDGWCPITETDDQEKFLAKRTVAEIDRLQDKTGYMRIGTFDSRGRNYPNAKGATHPVFDKRMRGVWGFDTSFSVTPKECEAWFAELHDECGLDDSEMEQLFHGKNAQKALSEGFDWLLLCEIWDYLKAKRTGKTNAACFIDANASGPTLMEISTGWHKAAQNADSRLPGWQKPYRRYANNLWADTNFRRAIGGGPGEGNLEQFLAELGKAMKGPGVVGNYGAGPVTMCLAALGMTNAGDHDAIGDDDDWTPELAPAFSGWTHDPKSKMSWVDQFCAAFKKPISASHRKTFPATAKVLAHLDKYWAKHLGEDGRGVQPEWSVGGWKHSPFILRRNRYKQKPLHYTMTVGGGSTPTTIQHKVLEHNTRGTELAANVTHALDGWIIMLFVLFCKEEGIPCIVIHDSVGVPRPFLRRANQLYVKATNEACSTNVWKQFGFESFGPIPKLDPDCGLLSR
tara:strand:+ start:1550 stop:3379 length:1830 start_codon:yes stop_codon:yes gene_type:complete